MRKRFIVAAAAVVMLSACNNSYSEVVGSYCQGDECVLDIARPSGEIEQVTLDADEADDCEVGDDYPACLDSDSVHQKSTVKKTTSKPKMTRTSRR